MRTNQELLDRDEILSNLSLFSVMEQIHYGDIDGLCMFKAAQELGMIDDEDYAIAERNPRWLREDASDILAEMCSFADTEQEVLLAIAEAMIYEPK